MITCDPVKRETTLRERGLDFLDAAVVFEGRTLTSQDVRYDYGEDRFVTIGFLENRMVVVGWPPRGADRHVFSMRKANVREKKRFGPSFA